MREILERLISQKENEIRVVQQMWNCGKRYGDGDPRVLEYFAELCRDQDQLKRQLESISLTRWNSESQKINAD